MRKEDPLGIFDPPGGDRLRGELPPTDGRVDEQGGSDVPQAPDGGPIDGPIEPPALRPKPIQDQIAEHLLGGGFQQLGTAGAAPFRSVRFNEGRQTAPITDQPIRLSAGAPLAVGSVGEKDDEARALRRARLSNVTF